MQALWSCCRRVSCRRTTGTGSAGQASGLRGTRTCRKRALQRPLPRGVCHLRLDLHFLVLIASNRLRIVCMLDRLERCIP